MAKDLPGTGLLNIASSYVKIREKQLERDAGSDNGPELDEVQLILSQPLPDDRKLSLLEQVIDRLQSRIYWTREAIDQVKGLT